jgi:hypothetical protein
MAVPFKNYRSNQNFLGYFVPRQKICIDSGKQNWLFNIFWAIFSQTHLVTLAGSRQPTQEIT